ncbi:hypothetical protein AB0G74_33380 [Streptomyces sp. NPDC020875]|uniref:hypothetical protein n=1 Tax=Streptomyces sp. NPDC020875 TaxID=3154898 RepID=UPI0033D23B03
MTETWTVGPDPAPVAPGDVPELLRARAGRGELETWLTSSAGRSLAVLSNNRRAMVMLLERPGDPGEHAVDPDAGDEWSDGFVLANGQDDEYPDQDTVPLPEALRIVAHILATGAPPPDAAWRIDR